MVKCQLCEITGHSASECPKKCQLCERTGHIARACPSLKRKRACETEHTSEADASDDEESDAEENVEPCLVCAARENEECDEAECAGAAERNAVITARLKAIAKGKKGGSKGKDKGKGTGDAADLPDMLRYTPQMIIRMKIPQLIKLQPKHIVLIPAVWRLWVWNQPHPERAEAHRKLMVALRAIFQPGVEKTAMTTVSMSWLDLRKAEEDMCEIEAMTDPKPSLSEADLVARLNAVIEGRGQSLLCFREARTSTWKVVRRAQEIYKGETGVDKLWTAAMTRATREEAAKTDSTTSGTSAGRSVQFAAGNGAKGPRGGRGHKGQGANG